MPLSLALDLGTTTITALAVDLENGEVVARTTTANNAELTSPEHKARGWSEWDANRISKLAMLALQSLAEQLGARLREAAGIGLTGQQHGVVLVDEAFTPSCPLINWQDRRSEEVNPRSGKTWLEEVRECADSEARERTGCTLSPGYMGVTLYWLKQQGLLPPRAKACFLVDFLGAHLTGSNPVTDPTSAASSGLFDVRAGNWDNLLIENLELPPDLFAAVSRGGSFLGPLKKTVADETGLPCGLPVCVGLGDNQASVYGSVADLNETALVNVGTGGQVTAWTDRFIYDQNLETRPFTEGYLLVNAGLCGGRTYAVLERFFQLVCTTFGRGALSATQYDAMNRLAAAVPPGADGLRCEPLFTGTRQNPERRGGFSNISIENFTPGHLTRALLEGMARVFHDGYLDIARTMGRSRSQLVGAGNGLRQNATLADIVARQFDMPMRLPQHHEEAAFGAALVAAVGLGLLPDRNAVVRLIRHELRAPSDAHSV